MIKPKKGLILHNLAVKKGGGGGAGSAHTGSANAHQKRYDACIPIKTHHACGLTEILWTLPLTTFLYSTVQIGCHFNVNF